MGRLTWNKSSGRDAERPSEHLHDDGILTGQDQRPRRTKVHYGDRQFFHAQFGSLQLRAFQDQQGFFIFAQAQRDARSGGRGRARDRAAAKGC